jgi:hypothetical protein
METTIITCDLCTSPIFPKNEDPSKRFPVRYLRYDSLCQTCYNKEKATVEQNNSQPIMQQSLDSIVTSREQFFNAERTDLALIEGTPFERVIKIRDRIDKWKNLLFEIRTRQESAQSALQELAQTITAEERAKLKISDISYIPNETKPKPKIARISSEEKNLNNMVNTLFRRAIDKGEMTEEQAREKVRDIVRNSKNIMITRMASGELKCTCASTPGICKVHEK